MSVSKVDYRIKNWLSYNQSLISRGRMTLWLSEDVIKGWYSSSTSGKRGRSSSYSDVAIESCLSLHYLFQIPLRMTQCFVSSLFDLLNVSIKAPDYSRLSRRGQCMKPPKFRYPTKGALDMVIDSTGLKGRVGSSLDL